MARISRKEAARQIGLEPPTLAVWDRKYPGRLNAIKLPNGRVVYEEDEIERFIAECRNRGKSQTVEN